MVGKKTAKEYLEESAMEMFAKRPVDQVSISDICENANVSTRTFYNNFKDKYDLINQCYKSRFDAYMKAQGEDVTLKKLMLYQAQEVVANPEFFRHVFQYTGQNNIRVSFRDPLAEQFVRAFEIQTKKPIPDDEKEAASFFAGGVLTYIEYCLNQPSLPSAEDATAFCHNAIPDKLKKYLP